MLLSTVVAAAIAGVAVTEPAHATIVDSPGYAHLRNSQTGTCIDAQYAAPGTQVVMWRCLNTEFEEWRKVIVQVPGNRYEHCACTLATMIVNHAMGLCLAVANGTDTMLDSGIAVVQQTCNPSDEKQWWQFFEYSGNGSDGTGRIEAFTTYTVLDVNGGRSDDGLPLRVWSNHYYANQTWEVPRW